VLGEVRHTPEEDRLIRLADPERQVDDRPAGQRQAEQRDAVEVVPLDLGERAQIRGQAAPLSAASRCGAAAPRPSQVRQPQRW
jgi:hypothetical protein